MKRSTFSDRALVLAPRGRDAAIAVAMLLEAGLAADACASLPELIRELNVGAAVVVVTEEALATADLKPLAAWIADQQEWSDLPFVLLTGHGGGLERNPAARRYLDVLGNTTFLERPFHPTTLVSLVRAALRGRMRQYEARARVEELRFLSELDEAMRGARDAPTAMLTAATLLAERLGASRCAYADVDADNDRFFIRDDYTAPGVASSAGTYSLDLFGPRAAAELRGGHTLVVRDVAAELAPGEGREMFLRIGIRAIVCRPLVKEGRLVAMMALHQSDPRDWQISELAIVGTVVERCWSHVERVGAEARLRESEERLRLATEHADIGFWDVDTIHDVLVWPPRVKAMFGISADVPVSMQDFYDGLHPDDREAKSAAYAAAADPTRRALYDVEYRTIGKEDGVVRWVAAKGRGVFVGDRCVRLLGTAIDVTARKAIEERIRDLNETLERRVVDEVAERTKAEDALRQAQKMEAVGQLTGGVAHDFNNLLMAVIGNLDVLRKHVPDDPRTQRLIDGAIQGANRGAALTQRLLAFARRQDLQLAPKDLSELVRGMTDLLAKSVGAQIELRYDLPDGLLPALVDSNQVELALLNLVVNARDAMPDGGVVTIQTDQLVIAGDTQLEDGEYIRLVVADSGNGMDAETLAKATEPFFSTKELGKGTGLGLSMIHGLAIQLRGTLRLTSEVDVGTRAELFMPASNVRAAVREAAPEPLGDQISEAKTILMVDDDALIAMSTVDLLEDLGHTVIEAGSGAAALEIIESGRHVDIMITDYSMPKMNGGQLAIAARKIRPDLPILLATGYAELPNEANIDLPRLFKPYHQHDLAKAIAKLLNH